MTSLDKDHETHLQSLLQTARGFAIYRIAVDPDGDYGGRVVLVSPSIRELLGIQDPYRFQSWFENIHPDDAGRVIAANRRSLEEGIPFDEEMRFYNDESGAWKWVRTSSRPIFDEAGRVAYFNGMTIDITVQKEAEGALQREKETLEARVRARTAEAVRRRQVAEGLREMVSVLNDNLPLSDTLQFIIRQAVQLLDAEAGILFHLDPEAGTARLEATAGLPEALQTVSSVPLLPTEANQASMHAEPFVVPDLPAAMAAEGHLLDDQDPALRAWLEALATEYGAYISLPLVAGTQLYGDITLYYRSPRHFEEEELRVANLFGDQASLAIENAYLRLQVEESAVTGERQRLARELHDAVTQTLFSASLIADVLPRLFRRDPERALGLVDELRELNRGALAEMRTLLLELRPTTLTESSLPELLQQLRDAAVGRHRLRVAVAVEGAGDLSPEVQVVFYRVAQEALNNVTKHARADQVTFRLAYGADAVTLQVEDDGRGFVPAQVSPNSLGLSIMRERAAQIGADLNVDSTPGRGTTVTLRYSRTPRP